MPVSSSGSKAADIEDIAARLKWRDQKGVRYTFAMLGCGLAGFLCVLPMMFGKSLFWPALLPILASLFFAAMLVMLFWYPETTRLRASDMDLLMESDSVEMLPLMAACHDDFRTCPRPQEKEQAKRLGEHAFQVLRDQKETPQLEIPHLRLLPVIRLLYYADSQADRQRLLNVIAAAGTPECFPQLDASVKWTCASPLKDYAEEQRRLRQMAHECKLAIRKAYPNVQASQSLLRGSVSNEGLLRAFSAPRPRGDDENLLQASEKAEETQQQGR